MISLSWDLTKTQVEDAGIWTYYLSVHRAQYYMSNRFHNVKFIFKILLGAYFLKIYKDMKHSHLAETK